MTDNRLPRRYQGSVPASPSARPPASPAVPAPQPTGRLHAARALNYRDAPDREACWSQLGSTVQQRLKEQAGQVLEWWAIQNTEGRVHAVVLGTNALAVAEPTVDSNGHPTRLIRTYPLLSDSFRYLEVSGKIEGLGRVGWSHSGSTRPRSPAADDATDVPGLDSEMIAFLGNLPAKAQQFLQAPFVGHPRPIEYERYYLRSELASGIQLFAGCYLTDRKVLRFVSGYRHSGHREPEEWGSWRLICRHAHVGRSNR
jgi:hypothetical protein